MAEMAEMESFAARHTAGQVMFAQYDDLLMENFDFETYCVDH